MRRCYIEFIVGARSEGVDECDLGWRRIQGASFPEDAEGEAWKAADAFDRDFDFRFTHRVVVADVEPAPAPKKPLVKAPAPEAKPAARQAAALPRLEGSPLPAAPVKRQLAEFRAQQRFAANMARLRKGLADGVSLEWLQPVCDLLELDIDQCGSSQLAARYREKFAELRELVARSTALRVVK